MRYFRTLDALRMILNGEVLMDIQKRSTKNEDRSLREDPIYPDEVHELISRPFDRNEYFVN